MLKHKTSTIVMLVPYGIAGVLLVGLFAAQILLPVSVHFPDVHPGSTITRSHNTVRLRTNEPAMLAPGQSLWWLRLPMRRLDQIRVRSTVRVLDTHSAVALWIPRGIDRGDLILLATPLIRQLETNASYTSYVVPNQLWTLWYDKTKVTHPNSAADVVALVQQDSAHGVVLTPNGFVTAGVIASPIQKDRLTVSNVDFANAGPSTTVPAQSTWVLVPATHDTMHTTVHDEEQSTTTVAVSVAALPLFVAQGQLQMSLLTATTESFTDAEAELVDLQIDFIARSWREQLEGLFR